MPNKTEISGDQIATSNDYEKLVRFLVEPFLENLEALSIHSEVNRSNNKIWLRVAFDKSDRGKVFGRGGHTIQAIRTTVQTSAAAHGESVFLDIYSDEPLKSDDFGERRDRSQGNSSQRRKGPAKPAPKISKK
jgi:uncharacterized protein